MKVEDPLQRNPDSHTWPWKSAQDSSFTSKLSTGAPFGNTKTLSGISNRFIVPFWVYDTLIDP